MAIDTNADFTPTIPDSGVVPVKSPYNPTGSFKFWAQKVIPLVYDDSLSYYEVLCKVVTYLNNVIQNVDNLNDSVNSTNQSFETLKEYVNTTKDTLINTYNELQGYVNTYFDNLDVQEEINAKLDAMAENGDLTSLLAPFIPDLVTQWLNDHVTPTSPVIDNTLLISGAGADAKVTGELRNTVIFDNNYNYLVNHPFNNAISNGVTFTRQEDGSVTVVGTVSGSNAYGYYFNASNKAPALIKPGKRYHLEFSGVYVRFRMFVYKNGAWEDPFIDTKESTDFEVPTDFVGFRIQLFVSENGTTVNETVNPKVVEIKPETQMRFERTNIGAASESAFSSIEKTTLRKTDMLWFLGKNVNINGEIQNNTSAALSSMIPVSEGTQIERIGESTDSNGLTLFMYVDAYENMAFKNRTLLNRFDVYTVPEDVNAICFGFARPVEQGTNMTTTDIENYFDIKWHFATESSVDAEKIPNSGEYIENLLENFCVFSSGSNNGISYDLIDNENHAYHVHGSTSNNVSFYNLYNGLLPECLERGKTYFIYYENSAEARNCHARFVFFDKDGNFTQPASSGYPYAVTIPDNAFSVTFRLYVAKNRTVDTTIKFLKLVEVQEQKMSVPYIISFVDDDASGTTYVERYYNSCKRNGVNGNYAVITNYWDRGATDPDLLLDYEDDGMAMLIHCSEQSYSLAPEWMDRNYDGCRKNLYKGMRAMQDKGFVNFRYWVMPYGYVNDDFKRLATDAGMKCMISSANFDYNNMGDADRYFIKRYSLNPVDSEGGIANLASIKTAIDNMHNLPSCWLIITTHFNEWGSVTWDTTVDETGYPVGYERMNEIIQYAKNSGAMVLTVPEAWRYYEPIIEANEQRYNKIRP